MACLVLCLSGTSLCGLFKRRWIQVNSVCVCLWLCTHLFVYLTSHLFIGKSHAVEKYDRALLIILNLNCVRLESIASRLPSLIFIQIFPDLLSCSRVWLSASVIKVTSRSQLYGMLCVTVLHLRTRYRWSRSMNEKSILIWPWNRSMGPSEKWWSGPHLAYFCWLLQNAQKRWHNTRWITSWTYD